MVKHFKHFEKEEIFFKRVGLLNPTQLQTIHKYLQSKDDNKVYKNN